LRILKNIPIKKEQKESIIFLKMNNSNEQKILDLVVKWTDHFKCRKDFREWRKKRIWQEKYQQEMIEKLRKLFGDLQNKKILDLGCGMGGLLVALNLEGIDAIGLEPNHDYCEITELRGQRYKIDSKVHEAHGENMPFGNHYFDVIICKDVLEHCKNPQQLLKESYRVLKPKGQMYVTATNRFCFVDPHYHLRFVNWLPRKLGNFIAKKITKKDSSIFEDHQELSNMNYFTIKRFKKIIKGIGFKAFKNLSKENICSKNKIKQRILLNYFYSVWEYILYK